MAIHSCANGTHKQPQKQSHPKRHSRFSKGYLKPETKETTFSISFSPSLFCILFSLSQTQFVHFRLPFSERLMLCRSISLRIRRTILPVRAPMLAPWRSVPGTPGRTPWMAAPSRMSRTVSGPPATPVALRRRGARLRNLVALRRRFHPRSRPVPLILHLVVKLGHLAAPLPCRHAPRVLSQPKSYALVGKRASQESRLFHAGEVSRRVHLENARGNLAELNNFGVGHFVEDELEAEPAFYSYGQVTKHKEAAVLVVGVLELVETRDLGTEEWVAVLERDGGVFLFVDQEGHDKVVRAYQRKLATSSRSSWQSLVLQLTLENMAALGRHLQLKNGRRINRLSVCFSMLVTTGIAQPVRNATVPLSFPITTFALSGSCRIVNVNGAEGDAGSVVGEYVMKPPCSCDKIGDCVIVGADVGGRPGFPTGVGGVIIGSRCICGGGCACAGWYGEAGTGSYCDCGGPGGGGGGRPGPAGYPYGCRGLCPLAMADMCGDVWPFRWEKLCWWWCSREADSKEDV